MTKLYNTPNGRRMINRFMVEEWGTEDGSKVNVIVSNINDDYYHVGNDKRDVIALCELLNEMDKEIINPKLDCQEHIKELQAELVKVVEENQKLKQRISELELLNR